MTDVNSSDFQSASSSRISDENNSSFILNQSNVPMDIDIDDDDDEIITSNSTKINGYRSTTIENENNNDEPDKEDVFHQGNPVLNKSFDVLPQIKDDDTPSVDQISDNSVKNTNILDTTVELPSNNDEFDEKFSQDFNNEKPVNSQSLLSNNFSLEYPYVIPQPVENTQPSSPPPRPSSSNPIETVTTLAKNMKLNVNKTLEGQEPSTSTTDKTFDTNTFVLKKKERRKVTTPATENKLNAVNQDTPPDLLNKQSPFNTPSTSLDAAIASRPATSQQQQQPPFIDPTRVM